MRGWLRFYVASVRLGLGYLLRHGYLREAVVRVVVPLDPSRYVELPDVARELGARPGEQVLDLASPKLLAAALARDGVDMTSVDQLESEIEAWRKLAPEVRFEVGDGRSLPFADASFDRAYSISVLEHIPEGGDEAALGELARVVKPGGRVVVTLPYARSYREEWREHDLYAEGEERGGRYFFQRWYDDRRVEQLVSAVPALEVVSRRVVRLQPNWNSAYTRTFPLLVPLGPFFGLLAREREGPGGDVVRLTLVRAPNETKP
jgi:SAM-dependent methyltransferase